jgi:hypothetical protein
LTGWVKSRLGESTAVIAELTIPKEGSAFRLPARKLAQGRYSIAVPYPRTDKLATLQNDIGGTQKFPIRIELENVSTRSIA